jgi:hypothetical protein
VLYSVAVLWAHLKEKERKKIQAKDRDRGLKRGDDKEQRRINSEY